MTASSGQAVCTIIARNYLAFARVLARSVHQHHPELPVHVLVTDDVDGWIDTASEPFITVSLDALGIPELRRFCFKYSRQQAVTATKPCVMRHLLDRGFRSVVFLDADILVTDHLDDLLQQAARHPILLTPHLVEHLNDDQRATRELNILLSGTYNGGCLAVRESDDGRAFLDWWQDRLHTHCRHAVDDGMHYDQRWLDLVPSLFDGVHVLRDETYNVAYWNLPERLAPCRFFHFSGFEPDRPDRVTRYSTRLDRSAIGARQHLFDTYSRLLIQAGFETSGRWPHGHGRFDNGVVIPEIARQAYLDRDDADRFGDPFATAHPHSYFGWLSTSARPAPADGRCVTRLWELVYQSRPDVQAAFPDLFGGHREAFLRWVVGHGLAEHAIDPALGPA